MKTQAPGGAEAATGPSATSQVGQTAPVNATTQTQNVQPTHRVDPLRPTDSTANVSATGRMDPVTQKGQVRKSTSLLMGMVQNIEKGQASLDKLISASLKGKTFSNSELIGLQASMYKYTQELELTGKVVEKATSGLKDTLKTQV